MKSPDHPVPSGDRQIARLFFKMLTSQGHEVELISQFRSWEGQGNPARQEQLRSEAEAETRRLVDSYSTNVAPDLIFVYHLYHKAPDWIGGELSRRFDIPYVLAEASTAPSQAGGQWASGHAQALACIAQAAGIISLNPRDNPCLESVYPNPEKILSLRPFADPACVVESRDALRSAFSDRHGLGHDVPWIMVVAMMRKGDKLDSFKALSRVLDNLTELPWNCVIVGDGPAADEVKPLFDGLGNHCFFAGELESDEVTRWLAAGDLFIWPSINEAFGMGLLEATAAGLPAVVFDYGGVGTIVDHGTTGFVCDPANHEQFINAAKTLLVDRDLRKSMSISARNKFKTFHTLEVAADRVDGFIRQVCHQNGDG